MAERQQRTMDWDKLRVFHAVAEAGSFTHAGDLLNLSQSAVSRQIGALEDSLQVPLFHRHARGLILTEQGEVLYRTARDVFARLTTAESRIREGKERPKGPMRVTTTVAFGSVWLTPRIKEFVSHYPDIELTLVLDDGELNLGMRAADVAIRMVPPRQPNLIQRHLITMRYRIYAVPEYLRNHAIPMSVADLVNHRLIAYGEGATSPVERANWLLETGMPSGQIRRAVLKVNSVYAMYRAVQSGLGLAALPDYMSKEAGNLVEVLPEVNGPSFDAFFVYPEELRESKRVMVFRDFLLQKIAEAGL